MDTPPPGPQQPAASQTGAPQPTGAPQAGAPQPGAPQQTGFYAGIRRIGLWRSDDHWFGGVAGGLAERLGVDALVVRGIFVVTVLLGGVGLLAYGLGWLLLPDRRDGRILLEEVFAGRFDIGFVGAMGFTIVGLGRGGGWLVGWPGMPHGLQAVGGLLWLALLAVVVAVVIAAVTTNRSDRARSAAHPATPAPWAAPGATPTGAPAGGPYASAPAAHPGAAQPATPGPYPAADQPAGLATHTTGWGTSSATAAPYAPTVPYAAAPVPPTAAVPLAGRTASGPPPAYRPPKPRASGPGVATVGAVVALSLLTLAGLLVANRAGDFDGPVVLTALGVAIVLAGLGIVVSGLRGRTSGVLGFLAIVGLLVSLPLGVVARGDWTTGGEHRAVAVDVTAQTRAEAERGWGFGLGDSTVDLTAVPVTDQTLTVPVSLGAGNLTVVVPSGTTVDAEVNVGAGSVTWDVGAGGRRQVSGGHLRETFASPPGDVTHQIHLRVWTGAGDVVIEEQQS
jgi:phage shock protein PspC (stress-responsive transcriptional regulator)